MPLFKKKTSLVRDAKSDQPMPEQQISLLYPLHRHPSAVVRAYLDFASLDRGEILAVHIRDVRVNISLVSCRAEQAPRHFNESSVSPRTLYQCKTRGPMKTPARAGKRIPAVYQLTTNAAAVSLQ
jgi:hypothetical protein